MKPSIQKQDLLTLEEVRDILDYAPASGELRWRRRMSKRVLSGDIAGCVDTYGYVRIIIKGKNYRAHRLGWLLTYGGWPDAELDHIDLDRSNNRLNNLREATRAQNMLNKKMYKNNKSGFIGVHFHEASGRYQAQYGRDGIVHRIGEFDTAEEASAAYQAAIVYRGEFRPAAA